MSRTLKLALASLAFIFIAALPAQAAPVVVNGNFETFVPSNGTGGGWTSVNIDSAGGHRTIGGNPAGNFILNDAGSLTTDPTISQLVSGFTIGQTYTLTGDYAVFAGSFGNPNAQSFAVDIGGIGTTTFGRPFGPTSGEGVFGPFSVIFTANATSILISFRAEINGDDSSFRIDNIAINQVGGQPGAVPEPTTMLLLGTGLAGVAVKKCRRRKASEKPD